MKNVWQKIDTSKTFNGWKDYAVIATGEGEKLERWGDVTLLRPDPQVVWRWKTPLSALPKPDAHYHRSESGGGAWEYLKPIPDEWTVKWQELSFIVKPMGFKHTGLFPEQSCNWQIMSELVGKANRPISALNLFGYTGGATVALAHAGASVCHVDSAKNMVDRCRRNIALNGLQDAPVRYIVDDVKKFIRRETTRGRRYDALIMDPPSYGRGTNGEIWKIEDDLYDFVCSCKAVLSDEPLFVLINSYTTGLQPTVLSNILQLAIGCGAVKAYEVGIPTLDGITLPCGCSAILTQEEIL